MPSNTIRISPTSHRTLKEISTITGRSLQDELDRAIEQRRRSLYLEGLKADYEALAADPKALAEFGRETATWEVAAADGLEGL